MLGKVCGWISFDGNHLKDGFVDQMRQDDEIIRPMIVGLFLLCLRFSQFKKPLVFCCLRLRSPMFGEDGLFEGQ